MNAISYGEAYPQFNYHSATYQELQTSERLDLISNEDFRLALSKYDDSTIERRFNLSEIRAVMLNTGYVDSKYAETAPLKRGENGEFQILTLVEYDFEAMVTDETILSNWKKNLRLQTWVHSNVLSARRDVDRVLEVIEDIK